MTTRAQKIEALTRGLIALAEKRAEIAACAFCQENKGQMHPPHFASSRCESGKRNHCSCDICL